MTSSSDDILYSVKLYRFSVASETVKIKSWRYKSTLQDKAIVLV